MKKNKNLILSIVFFSLFVVFMILVAVVDRQAIGPNNSIVGFAALNKWFADLVGVHMFLYTITDWASILPTATALVFAVIGAIQLIKRKKLTKVDSSILILAGFYFVDLIIYLFFNKVVINYRPVLIDGFLEPSFPSSTTLLSLTFMMFSIYQTDRLIKNKPARISVKVASIALMLFLVVGRVIAGVHWITDIIASLFLSLGLIFLYYYLCEICAAKATQKAIENEELNKNNKEELFDKKSAETTENKSQKSAK